MIGLVIVSHSKALANSLAELVRQIVSMAHELPIAACGGAGDDHQEFGTDAIEIMEAIQSFSDLDGILILADLGSAVLSAETALDLIPEELRQKVMICPGPIVEGAISAGVQASLGADLKTACQEAQQSLLPKLEHLGFEEGAVQPKAERVIESAEAKEVVLDIHNTYGLHARPAVLFVQKASQFSADIHVTNLTNSRGPVSAKSLNALVSLGAVQGHKIKVRAVGEDADKALAALKELADNNFGESAAPHVEKKQPLPEKKEEMPLEGGAQKAIPISDGYVVGELYHYHVPAPQVPQGKIEDPAAAWRDLQHAIEETKRAIKQRRQQAKQRIGEEQAAIFDAHILILEDPDLLNAVKKTIDETHLNPALAWQQHIRQLADQYQALEDEYLRQRAADVLDVGNQVLFALLGDSIAAPTTFTKPVILAADELTPTQTSQLDLQKVLGILTISGGATSHSAIIARSLGIPAISGVNESLRDVPEGTIVGLDGFHGVYWLAPDEHIQQELNQKRNQWLAEKEELLQASQQAAITIDGKQIEVVANVGNTKDAEISVKYGAEGVGLLRTEFLFLTRKDPPTEEEQVQALAEIGKVFYPRPVLVRTLDVGGDKDLPYIQLPEEANPFLGVRALRLSLQRKDLFTTQLRAILRVGAEARIRMMFPMVADIGEIYQAKQILQEVHLQLEKEGVKHQFPIETGIMVEIPSSALLALHFAKEVDFFSIGTNDLTQYTMAAERGNPSLAYLADALHPSVLKLIDEVVKAAHQEGKWVGVCGELAGDVIATPILVGLGVDELSMNAVSIPKVKAMIRKLSYQNVQSFAQHVLTLKTSQEVREATTRFLHHEGKE